MSRPRCLRFLAAALPLLLLSALLCQPADLRGRGAPKKVLPSDLALVPGDCAGFVTFRQSDLSQEPLLADLLALSDINISEVRKTTRLPLKQVERFTLVVQGGEGVMIVRTNKPYDSAKLLDTLTPIDPKPSGKDKPAKGKLQEKKVAGKTISYQETSAFWNEGICLVDRNVFVFGEIRALARLLGATQLVSEELYEALGQAGKHSIVACVQGQPLRALLAAGRPRDEELPKSIPPTPKDVPPKKDSPPSPPEKKEPSNRRAQKTPEAGRAKKADDPILPLALFPYKPLLMGRAALMTADLKPTLKATLKITLDEKADFDSAETALKTTLYVGGEVIDSIRQRNGSEAGSRLARLKGLGRLIELAKTALRKAKIERKDSALTASASLTLTEADRKFLSEAMIEANQLIRAKNNLKQLLLAMHAHNDIFGHLPPPASTDAKGKALLSWRVAILPYIEEGALYKEFKLDEPWDSPHNKKLLAKMPKVFAPLGVKPKQPHSTFYQLCTGPNTPFLTRSSKAWFPASFPDGMQNTFLIVEAGEAVPWTKPVDLALDPKKPLPRLGAQFKGIFLAGMADGSVQSGPSDLAEKILRLLIDPADGQVPPLWTTSDKKR